MTCEGGPAEVGGDLLRIKIVACDLLPRGVILLCRLVNIGAERVDEADAAGEALTKWGEDGLMHEALYGDWGGE